MNNKLQNKAFTLIELLAVIIILAIIALIAVPVVLNVIDDAKKSAGQSDANMVLSGINNYCATEEIKMEMDSNYESLCNNELTIEAIKKMVNLGNAEILEIKYYENNLLFLKLKSNGFIFSLQDNTMIEGNLEGPKIEYVDGSGANKPEMLDNMIPVIYKDDNWIYADIEQKWYDYDNKEWANVVILNDGVVKQEGDIINEDDIALWYVWIPRYKYQLFNVSDTKVNPQEIKIGFEKGTTTTGTVKCQDINFKENPTSEVSQICDNAEVGNWYTHPAFTFGETQLTGFWMSKFEVSGTTEKITIKPNVNSLRSQNISQFFISIRNISKLYNINGDSHMIKNVEWGAVAYLLHSKYGINEEVYINNSNVGSYTGRSGGNVGGNNNSLAIQFPDNQTSTNNFNQFGYYTYDGKIVNYNGSIGNYAIDRTLGTKASTTGNIYGVYDMAGGAYEYVMANMVDINGNFYLGNAGFTMENIPETKYYDSYSYSTLNKYIRGKYGNITKETNGWYNDTLNLPNGSNLWLICGGTASNGSAAGIFNCRTWSVSGGKDSAISSRAIIVFDNQI